MNFKDLKVNETYDITYRSDKYNFNGRGLCIGLIPKDGMAVFAISNIRVLILKADSVNGVSDNFMSLNITFRKALLRKVQEITGLELESIQ